MLNLFQHPSCKAGMSCGIPKQVRDDIAYFPSGFMNKKADGKTI
jgi:hypothetical protein